MTTRCRSGLGGNEDVDDLSGIKTFSPAALQREDNFHDAGIDHPVLGAPGSAGACARPEDQATFFHEASQGMNK